MGEEKEEDDEEDEEAEETLFVWRNEDSETVQQLVVNKEIVCGDL